MDIQDLKSVLKSPLAIGNNVLIRRSGEYHYLGKIISFDSQQIVLSNAAWVADSRYFADFMEFGLFAPGIEIEPFGNDTLVSVPRLKAEVCDWSHALPIEAIGR